MRTMFQAALTAAFAAGLFLAGGCDMGGPVGGPDGWWAFDEGTGQVVKNRGAGGNGGTIKDGLKWVDGKVGKALEFNGKGYVLIETASYLDAPQYTFTAWVKLKNTSDYQYIVWRGGTEFPEAKEIRNIDLWVTMGGMLSGILDYADAKQARFRLEGAKNIADGKWHLVAMVKDAGSVTFYVDGKKDASEPVAGKLAANNLPLWIGARPGDVAATGIIDEVKFFKRALTAVEVAALK